MLIENIALYHVRMPLLEPWVTAYGRQDSIESLFVRLRAAGVEGWGECAPAPGPLYNAEYTAGAFALARDVLGPYLSGQEITSGALLQHRLARFKGNEFAKSAFDNAWWDAHAKREGCPLWSLIGGTGAATAVGADIPVLDTINDTIARVALSKEQGYHRVKLKFNRDCSLDLIRSVRAAFPEITLHVDCNSGFTLDDIAMFRALDELDLAMIEQPLQYDDLISHAELQRALKTPICLDESITSLARAQKAIDIKACGWINIKTSRVGGLTNAIAIHDYCAAQSLPVWVGGMLESGVGQGTSLALSTLSNIHYACDIFPSARFYETDFAEPDIRLQDKGTIQAPSTPGHGFRPKMELIDRHCVNFAEL